MQKGMKTRMIGVLTGDIVNSMKVNARAWIKVLRKELRQTGDTPKYWEIYRGDSFQAEVSDPANALDSAIQLKAAMRTLHGIDVRIAIGIGSKTFNSEKITESNGSAFVHSGEKYEELRSKKLEMAIKSPWADFDTEVNLYIKLLLVAMKYWTTISAESLHTAMKNPEKSQAELGKMMHVKQNAVSARLKRARYDEIMVVINRYKTLLSERL